MALRRYGRTSSSDDSRSVDGIMLLAGLLVLDGSTSTFLENLFKEPCGPTDWLIVGAVTGGVTVSLMTGPTSSSDDSCSVACDPSGSGSGSGSCDPSGSCGGSGYGDPSGPGSGSGSGDPFGSGSGSGSGDPSGSGNGSGC